ncbi:MAG: outer membrane beta-barrel protein [Legionellaceae bacterium]|nr:outer membrane beta-barrel protein [Legionellaceae bacterium]
MKYTLFYQADRGASAPTMAAYPRRWLASSIILCCAVSTPVVAGTDGSVQSPSAPWYLVGSAGYSATRDANIRVDPQVWDQAVQGYSDKLGSAAALAFGVGTQLSPCLRMDLRGEHRGDYKYSRYQVGTVGTPGFTGEERIRRFKASSNTLMLSGYVDLGHASEHLRWQAAHLSIQPFIGAGIGANYLKVHDFHTLGPVYDALGRRIVASMNSSSTGTEFAWHGTLGLSAQINQRTTFAIGYNYFDGGNLPFPNYIDGSTSPPDNRDGTTVTAWRGKLRANEVFAELRVQI